MADRVRVEKGRLTVEKDTVTEKEIPDLTEKEKQDLRKSLKTVKRYMTDHELHNLKTLLQLFDDSILSYPDNTIEITGGVITMNIIRYEGLTNQKFKWQVRFSMNSDHKEVTLSKVRILERWD